MSIEVGSFWAKKGYVRRVIGWSGPSVMYREYSVGNDFVTEGQLLPQSLKSWGGVITENQARQLIPDLDERDQKEDKLKERARRTNTLAALKLATDDEILVEVRRRGLKT